MTSKDYVEHAYSGIVANLLQTNTLDLQWVLAMTKNYEKNPESINFMLQKQQQIVHANSGHYAPF